MQDPPRSIDEEEPVHDRSQRLSEQLPYLPSPWPSVSTSPYRMNQHPGHIPQTTVQSAQYSNPTGRGVHSPPALVGTSAQIPRSGLQEAWQQWPTNSNQAKTSWSTYGNRDYAPSRPSSVPWGSVAGVQEEQDWVGGGSVAPPAGNRAPSFDDSRYPHINGGRRFSIDGSDNFSGVVPLPHSLPQSRPEGYFSPPLAPERKLSISSASSAPSPSFSHSSLPSSLPVHYPYSPASLPIPATVGSLLPLPTLTSGLSTSTPGPAIPISTRRETPYSYGARNSKTREKSSERPHQCEHCLLAFHRLHDLKRHLRIHLDVKPFPCPSCEKRFTRRDALKRHLLIKGHGSSQDPSSATAGSVSGQEDDDEEDDQGYDAPGDEAAGKMDTVYGSNDQPLRRPAPRPLMSTDTFASSDSSLDYPSKLHSYSSEHSSFTSTTSTQSVHSQPPPPTMLPSYLPPDHQHGYRYPNQENGNGSHYGATGRHGG
ncbi:hypothetical protein T439DRAFT_314814 [Meredithblackwellia eburnea MCA 4105]